MAVIYDTKLHERAQGHWQNILPALGINRRFLNKKNGPCPMCGGKDRWRFTDLNGKGTWWCNHCSGGNGVALAMKFTGLPYGELARRIEHVIGGAVAIPIRAGRTDAQRRAALNELWQSGMCVRPDDPVDRWFEGRGLGMRNYPGSLRCGMHVRHSGPPVTWHPAMLAMVTDTSGKPATIHKTYITADGKKAPVDKVRMFCSGSRPVGGAVRLAPAASVLGVAEGIETAIAAMTISGIPTWAALDAGGVERFEPPAEIKRLIVFGDNNSNGTGQRAAYALASRLSGRLEIEVRIPEKPDTDWNDASRR